MYHDFLSDVDSNGSIVGPTDQKYSIRLGMVIKSQFHNQSERHENRHNNEFKEERQYIETILRDVGLNNYKKSFLTIATHFIPQSSTVAIGDYSTLRMKEHSNSVNLISQRETIEKSNLREQRLKNELFATRNELNSLRRNISTTETSPHNEKPVCDIEPFIERTYSTQHQTLDERMSTDLPQVSQMSSIQKSQHYVENHSTSPGIMNKSILNEMRTQQSGDHSVAQPIPVIYNSSRTSTQGNHFGNRTSTNRSTILSDENVKLVAPVQSVQRSLTNLNEDDTDSHHEEKTVTIKRKITRRKKGSENVSTLRDSYIDTISSPLATYYPESDTDNESVNTNKSKPNKIVSEIIPLKQAANNEAPPTIYVTSPGPVNEEVIIPKKKEAVKSSIPFENLKNLDNNETSSLDTYITQRQTTPVSTYSARKENIKSQQNIDDRNTAPRAVQEERNYSHRKEISEEIETITLQPIGKGVQDLLSTPSAANSRVVSRAATPRGFDTEQGTFRTNYYQEENKQMGNISTMPTVRKFANTNSLRNASPSSNYDLSDNRTINQQYSSTFFNKPPAMLRHGESYNRVTSDRTQASSFNRATSSNIQSARFNRPTFEPSIESSYYTVSNQPIQMVSSNSFNSTPRRTANEQSVNASWSTRTETYGTGNRVYQSPMSPLSNQGSISSNVMVSSAVYDKRITLQMVIDAEELWYQPNISRDEAINSLRDKEPGQFYVRNSSTVANAYGLAMKAVTLPLNAVRTDDFQSDLVRHYLIVTVSDASGSGVRLKDLDNEVTYPSLAHLVYAHCLNPIALPNVLCLPQAQLVAMDRTDGISANNEYRFTTQQSQQQQESGKAQSLYQFHRSLSSPGVNFSDPNHPNPLHKCFALNALYLGKVEVNRMTGDDAVKAAVSKIKNKGSRKTSTVEIKLDSTQGITLRDTMEKLFYIRKFPAQHVLHAAIDPIRREFSTPMLQHNGIESGRIFGIVVKKQSMMQRENVVHMFCEIDDSDAVSKVITFVNENYAYRR